MEETIIYSSNSLKEDVSQAKTFTVMIENQVGEITLMQMHDYDTVMDLKLNYLRRIGQNENMLYHLKFISRTPGRSNGKHILGKYTLCDYEIGTGARIWTCYNMNRMENV